MTLIQISLNGRRAMPFLTSDRFFPQTRAEIIGVRIPLSKSEAIIPQRLEYTHIGAWTAKEIKWIR
jgi:hypothetical protein